MEHEPLETMWTGRYLTIARQGRWEYVTRNVGSPGVGIVAVTDTNCLVLVEQFRIPVSRPVVELPAGLAGDVPGTENEPLIEAARRELLEETGYLAHRWTELSGGYASPGLTNEAIMFFLAEDLEKVGTGGGDASETIDVHEVPLDRLPEWLAARGQFADLKLLAGLHLAGLHWAKRTQPP